MTNVEIRMSKEFSNDEMMKSPFSGIRSNVNLIGLRVFVIQ
jgi:hypothetical protein